MEVFSLLLVVLFALVLGYCRFLVWLGAKTSRVPSLLSRISLVVLGLFAIELLLLVTLGLRRSGRLWGPVGNYFENRIGFLIVPLALANVLILGKRGTAWVPWYFVPFLCAPIGLGIFILGFVVYPWAK
jgi:hypothetical protein